MDRLLPSGYDASLLPPSCFAPDPADDASVRCDECGRAAPEPGSRYCAACAVWYDNDDED